MSDEINNESWSAAAGSAAQAPPPVGYCQDCGKPLTGETVRNVGNSLFCEPCLTMRVSGRSTAYGAAPLPGEPSPALAALLGFIPGVGAMYNGQYAKGIVHFLIFVVAVSLAKDVSGIFCLFAIGWVFYMVIEAYHTAVARRDGMPLPNPFGLNDVGERMGFGRTWGPGPNGSVPPVPGQATTPPPAAAAGYTPMNQGTGWVGYVPPSAFAGAPPVPPVDPATTAAAQQAPAWGHAPYARTYTGGVPPAAPSYTAVPPVAPLTLVAPARRLPIGAFWLIGLGFVFLLAMLEPDWHIGGRWLVPILLAALASWLFVRRLPGRPWHTGMLRWPVMLAVLAVLFALQSAYVLTLGQTWPVLFIAFGALLLVERATAGPIVSPSPVGAPGTAGASTWSEEDAERARAAWAASGTEPAAAERPAATEWDPSKDPTSDPTKDGQ